MTTALASIPDLVPAGLRRAWLKNGMYLGRDVYGLFRERVAAHPQRPAVIDDSGEISYEDLERMCRRIASRLEASGIGPSDVVAFQLPNGRGFCAVDLAVTALGAISLPLLMTMSPAEVRSLLIRSGAAAYVVSDRDPNANQCLRVVEADRSKTPALRSVMVIGGNDDDALRLDSTQCEEDARLRDFTPRTVDGSQPARINLSSGTEADPKMVVYSHDAFTGGRGTFVGSVRAGAEPMRQFWMVFLATSYGSNYLPSMARFGATLVLTARFDAEKAWEVIKSRRPSHLFGVPAMYWSMLGSRGIGTDLSFLRVAMSSAAKPSPLLVDEIERALGCPAINCYGSADGVNCHTAADDPLEKRRKTVGRPDPAVATIRIVDEDGNECLPGTEGEIWARGPMTPMCYLRSEELNERYRTIDGWVKSGDVGCIGADGYLTLVGRKKDVINRGGFNISAAQIESGIEAHPSVLRATCVGMPDARLGERICAFVVLRAGNKLTLEILNQFLRQEQGFPVTKLPEHLEILSEMPMSHLGKVHKHLLRERAERLAAGRPD